MDKIGADKMEGVNKSQLQMENEKMWLLVLKYTIPTVMGMLIIALNITIDRFWVGRIPGEAGVLGLTAIGLSIPIINVIMASSQLIGIGAAAAISIALGKDDKDNAEVLLNNSIILSIFVSILITFFGVLFAENLLLFLGASESSLPYALSYTKITLWSTIFSILAFTLNSTIRATGNIKIFVIGQLLAAILNILLDPLFIFTFNLGISGAAYATFVSQIVVAIFISVYYYRGKAALSIKRSKFKFNFEACKRILTIGLAPFIFTMSSSFVIAIANMQVMKYGEIEYGNGDIALGAFTIISSILMMFILPMIGINQGVQPIIGYNYGKKDYTRFKDAYKFATIYAAILGSIGTILVVFFSAQVVTLFNNDPLLVQVASEGIRVYLIALPFAAIQISSTNLFQAIGNAKVSIFLSSLRQILLIIPLYFILPHFFGLRGIWFVTPTADTIAVLITLFFVVRELKLISNIKTI